MHSDYTVKRNRRADTIGRIAEPIVCCGSERDGRAETIVFYEVEHDRKAETIVFCGSEKHGRAESTVFCEVKADLGVP